MAAIVAKCPVSGKEFDTGIETDTDSFARISATVGRVWCPHCEQEHDLLVGDTRIREAGSQTGQGSRGDGGATPGDGPMPAP